MLKKVSPFIPFSVPISVGSILSPRVLVKRLVILGMSNKRLAGKEEKLR
jgi:hypothetical protein